MSLKQELQIWSDALTAFDAQDFEGCISLFDGIAESSKIFFNIGLVQATIGSHELAVQSFENAIALDRYLAVAYFQSGVSNFLLGRYQQARRDFDDTYVYLRSNNTIDYEQLGLKFRLYSCEVLFNRGLSTIYLGQQDAGMRDFDAALKEKQTDEHSVIDEAYADRGNGYTVFSIPVGVLFRPSANKIKNLETKNYLGKATLVAATDADDAFTGFSGTERAESRNARRPTEGLSRSKTSAARLQKSGDGVAAPLRGRTSIDGGDSGASSPNGRSAALLRSQTTTAVSATVRGGGRALPVGLPTPPSSDEIDRGNLPTSLNGLTLNDRRTTTGYGGADIDDYYADAPSLPPINYLSPISAPRNGRASSSLTPRGQPADRVAKWAQQNVGAPPPSQSISRQTSASERSISGLPTSLSRPAVSPPRLQAPPPRQAEGSVTSYAGEREMTKVRVKLRYQGDTRGMSITPDLPHENFVERVRVKFNSPSDLPMKFKDADGAFITIIDRDDWESAIDEARAQAEGRGEGKLEIFLSDN